MVSHPLLPSENIALEWCIRTFDPLNEACKASVHDIVQTMTPVKFVEYMEYRRRYHNSIFRGLFIILLIILATIYVRVGSEALVVFGIMFLAFYLATLAVFYPEMRKSDNQVFKEYQNYMKMQRQK